MRKKIELTAEEQKVIGKIPSAKKATAIWTKFIDRKIQAKEDRQSLGEQLVAVRKALGSSKGGGGLFSRWLRVAGIPHDRAYTYMSLAGGAAVRSKRKSYVRDRKVAEFIKLFNKATTRDEKVKLLEQLIAWVKAEYNF